jgi:hypothetical protein
LKATVALLAFVATVGPRNSLAYTLRYSEAGVVVRWHEDSIPVRLDSSLRALGDENEVVSTLIEAFNTWEESGLLPAGFSLSSVEGADYGHESGREDSNDVIALTEDWPFPAEYSAVTISTYDADTGTMIDADVVFNAQRRWNTSGDPDARELDLLDVATHEVGHLLGFEHSDDPEATMYVSGPPGSTERRTLDDDDLQALTAAYGTPPALGRADMQGCAAEGRPTGAPLVSISLALSALLRRRRASVAAHDRRTAQSAQAQHRHTPCR